MEKHNVNNPDHLNLVQQDLTQEFSGSSEMHDEFNSMSFEKAMLKISKVSEMSELEEQKFFEIFNKFKFILLDCDPLPNPKENLLALTKFLGSVKQHKRSDKDGVVTVSYLPNSPGYLDTTNDTAPMHTDGSFEIEPPKVLVLQCEIPAQNGGLSQIAYAQSVYNYLAENHPQELQALFNGESFFIKRDEQIATHPILRRENNRIAMIFRSETADAAIKIHPEVKNAFCLVKDYVNNPKNQLMFKMKAHQVLVMDNTSVLHGRTPFTTNEVRKLNKLWFDGKSNYTEQLQLGFTPQVSL